MSDLAGCRGLSCCEHFKTFYARVAILEHLDDLEDLYLAEQRLIDARAGKTKAVPLENVMKRYGLVD